MSSNSTRETRKPARRRRLNMALGAAIAALTLAAVPSLASAQSLNTVAIDTDSSGGFLVLDVNGASTTPGAPGRRRADRQPEQRQCA